MRPILISAVILCAALIGGTAYWASRPKAPYIRQTEISASFTQRLTDGYWVKGPADAQVVQEVYSDFQCPACYSFHNLEAAAYADPTGLPTVQYRMYQFPLTTIHNKAFMAAVASEAAGRQGKFWEFNEVLFTRQPQWTDEVGGAFRKLLISYAGEMGMNTNDFDADLDDSELEKLIRSDMRKAGERQITATPTIFLNGVKTVSPRSADEWRIRLAGSTPPSAQ